METTVTMDDFMDYEPEEGQVSPGTEAGRATAPSDAGSSEGDMAFGWDAPLSITSGGGVLLEEGPATYKVARMTRDRFGGSEKMSACPVAELELDVTDASGKTARVRDKLFLNRKMLYKITAFGRSAGLIPAGVKDGDTYQMPWGSVTGARGRCEVGHREWTGDDGEKRTCNTIKRYL